MTKKLKSKQKRELNSLDNNLCSSQSAVNANNNCPSIQVTATSSLKPIVVTSTSSSSANGGGGGVSTVHLHPAVSHQTYSTDKPLKNERHQCLFPSSDCYGPKIVKVESLAPPVNPSSMSPIEDISTRLADATVSSPCEDSPPTPIQATASKSKSRRNRKKNKATVGENKDAEVSEPCKSLSGTNLRRYSGNNIVLVSHEQDEFSSSCDSVPPSCVDNYNPREEHILGLRSFAESDEDEGHSRHNGKKDYLESKDEGIYPVITSVSSGPHTFSYHSLSSFGIGPNSNSTSTVENSYDFETNANNNDSTRSTSRGESRDREIINWNNLKTCNSSSIRARSPDSGSSSSCGSCPSASLTSTHLDGMNRCQASFECFKLTNQKCGLCKSTYYCGIEHQQADWKIHKKFCLPYRLTSVGIGSDGVPVSAAVACRGIPEGQLIFSEKPVLVFPMADTLPENQYTHILDAPCVRNRVEEMKDKRRKSFSPCTSSFPACIGCLKVVPVTSTTIKMNGVPRNSCSKCALPLCSYHCQFLLAHQAGECEAIISWKLTRQSNSKECFHTLYMDVEILRALQLSVYDSTQYQELLEMKHNVRVEAYMKSERFKFFEQNVKNLVPLSAKMSGYNIDLILTVHSIISSLSFKPSLNSPYKMLFITQPLFAHDCVPNTLHFLSDEEQTGDPTRMKLMTKAASTILKGTIITIDFVPTPYLHYPQRRSILRNLLNINNCQCPRCKDPVDMHDYTSEINCPSCRQGSVRPEAPTRWEDSVWSCENCQEEISYTRIEEIETSCRRELANILVQRQKADKNSIVNSLLEYIRRVGEILNHKHHLVISAWCIVEESLRHDVRIYRDPDPTYVYTNERHKDFEVLGQYADAVADHLNRIRPGLWLDKGIVMFHKFYSELVQVSRAHQLQQIPRKDFNKGLLKCLKLLQESLKILQVYEGCNLYGVSRLTQEATKTLSELKCYATHLLKTDMNSPLRPLSEVVNEQFACL